MSNAKKNWKSLLIGRFIQGINNMIEKSFLVPNTPRTPIIYYLPKIHKEQSCPPGHPIVSGIDSVTSRVGKHIDHYLQPLVQLIPSYIKDMRHVINVLSNLSPRRGLWLVTADVSSLYTIIPHRLGLEAVKLSLDRSSGLSRLQLDFIME